jgi:hypothetical protein
LRLQPKRENRVGVAVSACPAPRSGALEKNRKETAHKRLFDTLIGRSKSTSENGQAAAAIRSVSARYERHWGRLAGVIMGGIIGCGRVVSHSRRIVDGGQWCVPRGYSPLFASTGGETTGEAAADWSGV